MPQIVRDGVRDTTTTTGTGVKTLANIAPRLYQTLAEAGAVNADTAYLRIDHATLDEWEVGNYTYNPTGHTITRVGSPLSSSNAGAAVNFSVGLKDVRLVAPAAQLDFVDVAALPSAVVGTDDVLVFRAGVPYLAAMSAVKTYIDFAGAAPSAFVLGNWTLTGGVESLVYNITALPSDGGSAITALEYTLNAGGTWTPFAGTGTGSRTITGQTATLKTTQIRAVNAVGNGAASDVKTATPTAVSSGLAIVNVPAPTVVSGTPTHQTSAFTAVTSGNALLVTAFGSESSGAPTITDSGGGSYTLLHSYSAVGDAAQRFYVRANITNAPTWVRATYGSNANGFIAAMEVSGGGSSITADTTGGVNVSSATTAFGSAFTSTVANTIFIGTHNLSNGSVPTGTAPITSVGLDGNYGGYSQGLFPTAGANTTVITLADSRNGHKAWCVFRAA
jgi:hypothetical protein